MGGLAAGPSGGSCVDSVDSRHTDCRAHERSPSHDAATAPELAPPPPPPSPHAGQPESLPQPSKASSAHPPPHQALPACRCPHTPHSAAQRPAGKGQQAHATGIPAGGRMRVGRAEARTFYKLHCAANITADSKQQPPCTHLGQLPQSVQRVDVGRGQPLVPAAAGRRAGRWAGKQPVGEAGRAARPRDAGAGHGKAGIARRQGNQQAVHCAAPLQQALQFVLPALTASCCRSRA